MFLENKQDQVDWENYYDFCERYNFRIFADAMNSISVNYLGVKVSNPAITTESIYAEKIMHSVLYDDDYIYNAGEGKWRGRLHLIKSLFKNRWKYKEIYHQSVWEQLWWYFTGFIFHTEKTDNRL